MKVIGIAPPPLQKSPRICQKQVPVTNLKNKWWRFLPNPFNSPTWFMPKTHGSCRLTWTLIKIIR